MKLESLRGNDVGSISAWIPKLGNGPESITPLTYPQFAQLAFYYSAQQIEQLEFSRQHIQLGNSVQTSVGLWFISVEAYINSILRIVCFFSTANSFEDFKTKDLGPRIKALFDILKIDRTPFYSGPFQRLEEFKRYRNAIFHDRTNDKPLDFHKTSFSDNPMHANQVDVMQASVIALETYSAFRYAIPCIDLMPQIMVTKDDSFFFVPMDELYTEVLRPYFEGVLAKHSLTTSVTLDVAAQPMKTSEIFHGDEIKVIVKAIPDTKYDFTPSPIKTNLGKTLFDKVRNKVIFDTSKDFRIANYNR